MKYYFRLIRIENLLIIALTQCLIYFNIIVPYREDDKMMPYLNLVDFSLIVIATMLIAAAGNAINDYFDMRIDRINKPERIILGKHIERRMAIHLNNIFNLLGVFVGLIAAYEVGKWSLGFVFLIMTFILLLYSSTFKKLFLVGNIIIALLSAFVPFIIVFFECFSKPDYRNYYMLLIVLVYCGFAFLISLLREIIKDVEDVVGDEACGCKTIAVVFGVDKTLNIVKMGILITLLLTISFISYIGFRQMWIFAAYATIFVLIPMILVYLKSLKAKEKNEIRWISLAFKFIMLTGVLSTFLIRLYF